MSNSNLPEYAKSTLELAGVSTDGWESHDNRDNHLVYPDLPEGYQIRIDCDWYVYIEDRYGRDRITLCCDGYCHAARLADRLKRAFLGEPDPRVAELEAINKELCDVLGGMVPLCENHPLIKGVFESLVIPNTLLNDAKAVLAKVRSK